MNPYNEPDVVQFAQDCVALYPPGQADAGRIAIAAARMQFDVNDSAKPLGYAISRAKHLAELKAEINPNPVQPPIAPASGPNGNESGFLGLGPSYFTDSDGQPWPFIGYHMHTLMVPVLAEQDIGSLLDFPIEAGFNTLVVIGVHLSKWEIDHGIGLDPRSQGYYDALFSLCDTCAARKIRLLFYAFGPGSDTLTAGEQQAHWKQSCAIVRGRWNLFMGKGNESNVNGWREDDFGFPDMGGVRVTQGTSGGNVDPHPPYLDFVVYETRQDSPGVVYDNGTGMRQMSDGDFAGPAVKPRPLISGEWGMFDEKNPDENGDRRFTDPKVGLDIGLANGWSAAGGAAGCTRSLVSQNPGPIAAEGCRNYARGVKAAFLR